MPLALATAALVAISLSWLIALPRLRSLLPHAWRALLVRVRRLPEPALAYGYDPGRELRAEQRARALLRSCVNKEEWAMYSELGFLRVFGGVGAPPQAYLLYAHKPILAYAPESGELLGEYCVEFPDHSRPYGSSRLPDADDVLAKWMALAAQEDALIERANMHLPGRQIDFERARRDIARLSHWERERARVSTTVATGERHGERERTATSRLLEPAERVASRDRPSRRAGSVPAL